MAILPKEIARRLLDGPLAPMLFRRTSKDLSVIPHLSAGDLDALEDIRSYWQSLSGGIPSHHQMIDLALRNIERDLDSRRWHEVMRDLEREIAYRKWRATNVPEKPAPEQSAEPVRHSRQGRGQA